MKLTKAPSGAFVVTVVRMAELRYTLDAVIKKVKGKYTVLSETTGRSFGGYRTLAEARRRLRQVEFFKHLSKNKRRK